MSQRCQEGLLDFGREGMVLEADLTVILGI